MIPEHLQQAIKDRADIVEVVGHFLSLRRAGSGFKALCPFHDERTPSFLITPSKGIFKCFGCGKGGDAIQFLMELKGFSYPEALTWLANHYNIFLEAPSIAQLPYRVEPRPTKPTLPPSFIETAIFQKAFPATKAITWCSGFAAN